MQVELDQPGASMRRWVQNGDGPTRHPLCHSVGRFLRQPFGDLLRLGVPDEHLRRDLVGRAAADRVVRRVLEDAAPGQIEEPLGPGVRPESLQRLGVALERSLRTGGGHLQVDPGRGDAHQHVGPGSRAELAFPPRMLVAVRAVQIAGQRLDLDPGLACEPDELRQWFLVVGPVHREDRVAGEERLHRLAQGLDGGRQAIRDGQEVGAVRVALGQVLRAHRRPVRRLPREGVLVDGGRHAAPDHSVLDAGQPQDLGHLRDVPEHVGEVPDSHRTAQLLAASQPALQVPEDRLAGDEELVDERLPRPDRHPALFDQPPDALLVLRPHLEVVVDGRELPVEREHEVRLRLQQVEHAVDEPDQLQPKALEGEVPLPVPVGVRDELDGVT